MFHAGEICVLQIFVHYSMKDKVHNRKFWPHANGSQWQYIAEDYDTYDWVLITFSMYQELWQAHSLTYKIAPDCGIARNEEKCQLKY